MYSIEEIKKVPAKTLLKLIDRMKKFLIEHDIVKDMCKEKDVDPSIIDIIPMRFADIPVSARTDHGVITFNYKLLCDGDFVKDYGYAVHEIQHWLDQCYNKHPTPGANDGDYLHNPAEQKGFKRQIEYIDDEFGENEAENYVDHLLDHHNRKGKDRNELKETLMEKVNE
jgi:hypothetical protein